MGKARHLTEADLLDIEALPRTNATRVARRYGIGLARLNRIWIMADKVEGKLPAPDGLPHNQGRPTVVDRPPRRSKHFEAAEPGEPEDLVLESDSDSQTHIPGSGCEGGAILSEDSEESDDLEELLADLEQALSTIEAGVGNPETFDEATRLLHLAKPHIPKKSTKAAVKIISAGKLQVHEFRRNRDRQRGGRVAEPRTAAAPVARVVDSEASPVAAPVALAKASPVAPVAATDAPVAATAVPEPVARSVGTRRGRLPARS